MTPATPESPITRHFLDWNQPFLTSVLDHLCSLTETRDLSNHCLIVPTSQAGRRLREGLAERNIGLAPRVVTPGHFMRPLPPTDGTHLATDSIETLAWLEVLEALKSPADWAPYAAAFPQTPGQGESTGWALPLAKSLANLRRELLEAGVMIAAAASNMAETIEADRWAALALLERQVESLLKSWNYTSRSVALALHDYAWTEFFKPDTTLLLVGLVDLPEILVRHLTQSPFTVETLIAAPEKEAAHFDQYGRPLDDSWAERTLGWPGNDEFPGEVHLTGDPTQQAQKALSLAAQKALPSDQITLGTADPEVAQELVRLFGEAGWTLFDPGQQQPPAIAGFLRTWSAFLRQDSIGNALDLLACTQTGGLVKGQRPARLRALSQLRDQHLIRHAQDLETILPKIEADRDRTQKLAEAGDEAAERSLKHRIRAVEAAELAQDTLTRLANSRQRFLRDGFHLALKNLLPYLLSSTEDDPTPDDAGIHDWLYETAPIAEKVDRPATFWLDLLLGNLRQTDPVAPADRVLDIYSWLELLFQDGPHLIICGMNETLIPARESTDPWLPEASRRQLRLSNAQQRASRDTYLYHALLQSRPSGQNDQNENNRLDLLLGKSSFGGDVYQPSRLLLKSTGHDLAHRVKKLFQDVPPASANLSSDLEEAWKWNPDFENRLAEKSLKKLSATKFRDYLECPYRFYLQNICGYNQPEPERVEWNARDFGNLAHLILENFGRDPQANSLSNAPDITDWTHAELDRQLVASFHGHPPLAIRIQADSLRQRLEWFAKVQAAEYAAGWRIINVEENFTLTLDGFADIKLTGQIDRIEQHTETGAIRILDYKTTAKADDVRKAHLTNITAATTFPPHLEDVEEIRYAYTDEKGKDQEARWKNLQIPLYMLARPDATEVGYFALGESEGSVALSLWENYGESEKQSAQTCAEWVLQQIQNNTYWPPNPKPKYENYDPLLLKKSLEQTTAVKA